MLERALLIGTDTELLEDYFGEDQVATLRRLAREARPLRGRERVLILPGIMGSTLGYERDKIWNEVLWVDPMDILFDRLNALRLGAPGGNAIKPLGVFLFAYLSLKLRLRASGFDAEFYAFDWRLDIGELGKALAQRLREEERPVHLIAHSMGGLVARASLTHQPPNIRRIITLGTPHYGSYSPIQAFRGVHSILRKIALLDLAATPDELGDIFKTFPGLCQMLPASPPSARDYFSLASWPGKGVLPAERMLNDCRGTLPSLPADYPDLFQIVGCNRETVVTAENRDDEFVYTLSFDGDGTVPRSLAVLPDTTVYYVVEEHGSMPNNPLIAKAIEDILTEGKTSRLASQPPALQSQTQRTVREQDLVARSDATTGSTNPLRRVPSGRGARELLNDFVSPVSTEPAISGAASGMAPAPLVTDATFDNRIVIGRRHQLRLDLTLIYGDITAVDASAYVLGLFGQVSPGGAARAVDELMNGAVMQMSERRMLATNVGAVSFLPKGRHPVQADLIAFVGLGAFDAFKEETLEAASENLIRTLLLTRVNDFAMVPFGGGTGIDTAKGLHHMMSGFTRGLVDADGDYRFRGITICEVNEERYKQMRRCLYGLCGTALFDDVEVTLHEKRLAPSRRIALSPPAAAQPIYLIVRQEMETEDAAVFISSLLTAGQKATTFSARQPLSLSDLNTHLEKIGPEARPSIAEQEVFGRRLGELILSADMREVLAQHPTEHVVVVHDAGASRIPWETLHIGDWSPALTGGLSHRYEARDLSTTKWLQKRQENPSLNVLLISNPTEDLDGAEAEGERIAGLMGAPNLPLTVHAIRRKEARRSIIIEALSSGRFDVVHYAGHAFFDQSSPERSGIICAGGEVLSGSDCASLPILPSLMVFNACEAARIRRWLPEQTTRARPDKELSVDMGARLRRGVGFAEALLRGGVANYVGTYWPVADVAAEEFALVFYQSLLAGRSLGEAIMQARHALKRKQFADWADYVLYGDTNFVLKPAELIGHRPPNK